MKDDHLHDEEKAIDLLMRIVTLARNGQGYKHLMKDLRRALDRAPGIKKVVAESVRSL